MGDPRDLVDAWPPELDEPKPTGSPASDHETVVGPAARVGINGAAGPRFAEPEWTRVTAAASRQPAASRPARTATPMAPCVEPTEEWEPVRPVRAAAAPRTAFGPASRGRLQQRPRRRGHRPRMAAALTAVLVCALVAALAVQTLRAPSSGPPGASAARPPAPATGPPSRVTAKPAVRRKRHVRVGRVSPVPRSRPRRVGVEHAATAKPQHKPQQRRPVAPAPPASVASAPSPPRRVVMPARPRPVGAAAGAPVDARLQARKAFGP